MKIILTEDVSIHKGWTRGRSFDWERPTISAITANLGHAKWFEQADRLEERSNVSVLRKKRVGDGT